MTQWTSVNVEGGLFPADILDAVAAGTADGQRPADFQLEATRLLEELQAAFGDIRSFWDAFRRRAARTAADTSLTRQAWVIPLLERLGFYLEYQAAALSAGNGTYTISHLHGSEPRTPVHIVALDQELDRRDSTGRRSPHALLQEYLNRSGTLWGLVTNGRKLRLLRDTERMAKPSYVEFDLEGMIESDKYSEFALLYRLLHATRFPLPGSDPAKCWLETYYQQGNDLGGRVRDGMRDGVSAALEILGNAFLKHDDNDRLRDAFRSGRLDAEQYYRQLLRLVYRFLFLMVTEERRLVFPEEEAGSPGHLIYDRYYSVSRLRDRSERYFAEDRHYDLWEGVKSTFALFREDTLARKLGLRALDGELFGESACADLEASRCLNADLLRAVRELSTYRQESGPRRRVNFRDIDVEEFGSVYESLLEYHPVVDVEQQSFSFLTGSERKSTGSYYTPSSLVQELIESALVPVLQERVAAAKTRDEKAQAILDMRVIDPAAGSGHFLLAAARRMARELARVRTDEAEPPVEDYRRALRDVIRNCLYAVDKNPLAVDLCKVALWIEGHNAGLPLGFLDHHIKLGDSLVGVFDLGVLEAGIPDEAYKPVTGDAAAAARGFRDRNRQEKRQAQLRDGGYQPVLGAATAAVPEGLAPDFAALGELADDTPADVKAKEELYEKLRGHGTEWWRYKTACDLWTYAFFAPLLPDAPFSPTLVPTSEAVFRALRGGSEAPVEAAAMACSQQHPFFHWPLEFPDVFAKGGFDVVLGNPPWERVKLQEQEFFGARNREIAAAPNKAARDRLIARLEKDDPGLYGEFQAAKHDAEATSEFIRGSGRFPLGGRGDVNTYAVFAETKRNLLNPRGRAGMIVPTGIATDDTTKDLFASFAEGRSIVSLYDFENREGVFAGVHRSYKFCLLTLAGKDAPVEKGWFAFYLTRAEQLRDEGRIFTLTPEDFALFNPNTRNAPVFRTRRDYEVARKLYQRAGVFVREGRDGGPEENPWGVTLSTMFHMSNDSGLFRTAEELRIQGFALAGNVFRHADGREYLPLYEAKLFHQYDHRFATFEGTSEQERRAGNARELTAAEKQNPATVVLPRYWVPAEEVAAKLGAVSGSERERERERERVFAQLAAGNWRFGTSSGARTREQGSSR